MRLVTIPKEKLKKYTVDKEMLQKADRPCALVLRLKFRGRRYDFAVPLRSNINPSTPKNEYFALPPRHTTKPNHRHGIHYAKMFPIDKRIATKFNINNNIYYGTIKAILDKNEKSIINECQDYLNRYEANGKPKYSTDLDLLLKIMQAK